MKVRGWIKGLAVLGVLGAALAILGLGLRYRLLRVEEAMRVTVRNATAGTLTNVNVAVTYSGNAAPPHGVARASLAPGEALSFHPRTNDVNVVVTFGPPAATLGAVIDLWTGESYLLEIRPDGTLQGDYVHEGR